MGEAAAGVMEGFGTCNPHGVDDVDRAGAPRRLPAASMVAHIAASAAELAARELPEANVPPCTAAGAPPAVQSAEYPLVTRVEQVVRPQALRRMRNWWRQLRRCMRAAAAGDWRRARRLRPPDMWLDHEECTVEGMGEWDWDLRPLALGLPAVPLVTSDTTSPPSTSVLAAAVREAAEGFADEGIVEELLSGVRDDSGCRRGTLLCAPHAGAFREAEVAGVKLAANEAMGWAAQSGTLPCWPLRTCPYSIVDESERAGKPKWRLTTDLSWPHPGAMVEGGVDVGSVNDGIDQSQWPANPLVSVATFAEAVAIMQGGVGGEAGRRVAVWGLDCEAFYRAIGRQRRELWRNGVVTLEGVQLDERCCFGDASAAAKCARVSNLMIHAVRAELRRVDEAYPTRDAGWMEWQRVRRQAGLRADLHWAAQYIDDLCGSSADDAVYDVDGLPVLRDGVHVRRPQLHFEAAQRAMTALGWVSAASKEVPPCRRMDMLGAEIDLDGGELSLTEAKRLRYGKAVAEAAASEWADDRQLQRLYGRLAFAMQCFPYMRQHLHGLRRLRRAAQRAGRVQLSGAAREDLRAWGKHLEEAVPGIPLARSQQALSMAAGAGAVYADASGESGFAAWTVVDGELIGLQGEWTTEEREGLRIEAKELLASTWGLVAFSAWLPRDVVSFSDNTLAVSAMRSMLARSAAMSCLVARRTAWLLEQRRAETSLRVTTKRNVWADVGSRAELGGWDEMARLAAAEGLRVRRVGVPEGWRGMTETMMGAGADEP